MHVSDSYSPPTPVVDWPPGIGPAIELRAAGLVLGQGTELVRLAKGGSGLALDADRDRCLALLSVAVRRSVAPELFDHVEAAASHWARGDKALANLRLIFAGLPRLDDPADAYRLRAAEYLLDEGMSPRELMKELGLEASAIDLGKYDPDQPRVPAGSGQGSGRWTDGMAGAEFEFRGSDQASPGASPTAATKPSVRQSPKLVQVAANGLSVLPGSISFRFHPEIPSIHKD